MAEINVVERKHSVWRWLIPALIVLALIWVLLSMRDNGTATTSGGAVADTTVSGAPVGTATP